MGKNLDYASLVNQAYEAVKELGADDIYKIEGYKIVLRQLVNGQPSSSTAAMIPTEDDNDGNKPHQVTPTDSEWANKIAHDLDLTENQVTEIYYFNDDKLKLLIDRKKLPSNESKSTLDIAALISAGRQSLGLDDKGTSYSVIKDALISYNCLNKKNWRKYIMNLGNKFLYEGDKSDSRLRLTNRAFQDVAVIARKYIEA